MNVLIASLNTAVERLLIVEKQQPGTVHRLLDDKTLAGGKGVNVARVLRTLNTERPSPLLVGFLGGATGRLCEALLEQEGLAGSWASTSGETRICEVIVEQNDPLKASVYNARGPEISSAELHDLHARLIAQLPTAAALICTGSLPAGVSESEYAGWIALARQHHVLSLLDSHGAALLAAAQATPDIIKINKDELHQVSERRSAGLISEWQERGVSAVIITDGMRPTLAQTPDGCFEVLSPDVKTLSSVGSGDAHCAGLMASLLTVPQAGWARHLAFAAACGAANAASITAGLAPHLSLHALAQQSTVRPLSRMQFGERL